MNFSLPGLPERPLKPRNRGLTMVMDKGLSVSEATALVSSSSHLVDFVKLGFGTSMITGGLTEKINLYHEANIKVYLGGTLFEAYVIRGLFDEYEKLIESLGLTTAEVSDGSLSMDLGTKCSYISRLAKKYTVLSEIGSKDASVHLEPAKWVEMMKAELDAGSIKVIAEARESGTVGIFDAAGKAETSLIDEILSQINSELILWEAPLKTQQVWFIKKLGSNVNLGNVASNEVIALETLRLGLRGDTFMDFLPDELKQ